MNIIEAIRDPNVFGPLFEDLGTWRNWMAVLRWLYGLSCDEEDMALFQKMTGRTVINPKGYDNAILVMGRRSGKTRIAALMMLYEALFVDRQHYRAPGEVVWHWGLAVDKGQATNLLNYVAAGLELFPGIIKSRDAESVLLKNGIGFGVKAVSQRSVRSYTTGFICGDESAWWRDEKTLSNPLDEVLTALQPSLVPNGKTVLISSPWTKSGEFYAMFKENYGNDEENNTLVVQASSSEMNPTLNVGSLLGRMLRKSKYNSNEYSGQFRDDSENLFSEAALDAVMDKEACPPDTRLPYVAFADAAGGSGKDSYTLAIALKTSNGDINICRIEEREPPFDPIGVTNEYADILKLYHISSVTGDKFGGDFPVRVFLQHGIRMDLCREAKSQLYAQLQSLVNARKVHLPKDDDRLKAQLISLERTGRDGKIDAPGCLHEDRANAVAGAAAMANETVIWTEKEKEARMPRKGPHQVPERPDIALTRGRHAREVMAEMAQIADDWMTKEEGCNRIVR